jgi:hypothetical protein
MGWTPPEPGCRTKRPQRRSCRAGQRTAPSFPSRWLAFEQEVRCGAVVVRCSEQGFPCADPVPSSPGVFAGGFCSRCAVAFHARCQLASSLSPMWQAVARNSPRSAPPYSVNPRSAAPRRRTTPHRTGTSSQPPRHRCRTAGDLGAASAGGLPMPTPSARDERVRVCGIPSRHPRLPSPGSQRSPGVRSRFYEDEGAVGNGRRGSAPRAGIEARRLVAVLRSCRWPGRRAAGCGS